MYPFVKWAGGKRQMLNTLKQNLPLSYNKYYEPFIGGGALLLETQPEQAIINDINAELIHVYRIIQSYPTELVTYIQKLDAQHCDTSVYLKNRTRYNQKISLKEYDVELAALFIWINKHCFNGLYRVNQKGEFNVPYNNAGNIQTIDKDNIINISNYLQSVQICNKDFEQIFDDVVAEDFVFFDSPYDDSFTGYSKNGFSEQDHIRLANLFQNLTNLGCYCLLTNHNTPLINNLYKDFYLKEIDVRRSINRDGKNRYGKEVIITNYLPKGDITC